MEQLPDAQEWPLGRDAECREHKMRKNGRCSAQSGKWLGRPPRVLPHIAVHVPLAPCWICNRDATSDTLRANGA